LEPKAPQDQPSQEEIKQQLAEGKGLLGGLRAVTPEPSDDGVGAGRGCVGEACPSIPQLQLQLPPLVRNTAIDILLYLRDEADKVMQSLSSPPIRMHVPVLAGCKLAGCRDGNVFALYSGYTVVGAALVALTTRLGVLALVLHHAAGRDEQRSESAQRGGRWGVTHHFLYSGEKLPAFAHGSPT